jgi:hypothetical protein
VVSKRRAGVWLFALVLALAALPANARVRVELDRSAIVTDESFVVTFTSDADVGDPDFSPLERDFDILGRSSQNSLQIINGRAETRRSWTLNLIPKRSGTLTLPSIDFGGDRSDPVTIEVGAGSPGRSDEGDVFIIVEANPQPAYVQAQILVTVRLYVGVRVGNASLSELQASGALVQKLGDDRRRDEQRGGRDYIVFERRYAVFAEQSGTLTLDPVKFEGDVISRGVFGRYKRVASEPMDLQILPAPPGVDIASWLPASKVTLREQWQTDPPVFRAGEPVKRTLELSAQGLTAAQLPPIVGAAIDNFRQYTDQPALEDRSADDGVTGVRTETLVMLPREAGHYVLPAIELQWWNTRTQALETVRVPEREVDILPAATPDAAPPAAALPAPGAPQPTPRAAAPAPVQPPFLWIGASALCAAGWTATLLLWWASRRRASGHVDRRTAIGSADAGAARRELRAACERDDSTAARRALVAWARARWGGTGSHAFNALRSAAGPALAREIERLERALYGAQATTWSGRALWDAFVAEVPAKDTGRATPEPLAPLHP